MKILLVSGLNAPPDGNGLADLAGELSRSDSRNVTQLVHWNDVLSPAGVYIGHSYGVAAIMKYIDGYFDQHNPVIPKLIVSLDGVPNWDFKQYQWKEWMRPTCDKFASYKRVAFFPPWSSGIRNAQPGDIDKTYFWATHNSIPRDPAIHAEVVGLVKGLI